MSASPPDSASLQEVILARLLAIDAKLDRLLARADHKPAERKLAQLKHEDRAALAGALPEIHRLVGVSNFVAADLTRHAARDPALRRALVRALGGVAGRERRLGTLLRKGVGFEVNGFRVVRLGEVREGAIWVLERMICGSDAGAMRESAPTLLVDARNRVGAK